MELSGFFLQWGGAWLLATAAGRCSRRRRWRLRWRRAARGVGPVALLAGCAAGILLARGELSFAPHPLAATLWTAGSLAALGFGSLWTAGRLEARGRRRTAGPLAWLGGLLALGGCLGMTALSLLQTETAPWIGGLWLSLGTAGLLAGLSRKPRPTGTWAAVAYVTLAAATAWRAQGW